MNDSHKKAFWAMMNVTMELTNHPPLSKEAVLVWWHKLSKFEYKEVEKALDNWLDKSNKPPTPSDIIGLCKPVAPVYLALPAPVSYLENKQHINKLNNFIAERLKPKTDYRAWAKRIKRNPQNFPQSSVESAEKFA